MALSSCVQDLPAGSPPEAGSDDAMQDAPTPPEDQTIDGGPDSAGDVGSEAREDVSDARSGDAGMEAGIVDTGVALDSSVGFDATDAGDANDASRTEDASDGGSASEGGDSGGANDGGDGGPANDASDAASDASVSPCTLVQSSVVFQGAGSLSMSLPGSSTPGNLLVIVFAVGANVTPPAPSGWTQAIFQIGTSGAVGIWYLANNPGGITSVTMDGGGTNSVRGEITEWTFATHVDQVASFSNTSSKSLTVSTPAITSGGECAIAGFAEKLSGPSTVSFVPGTGWSTLADNGSAVTNFHVTCDERLSPALGALSETEATGITGDWVGAIATFR